MMTGTAVGAREALEVDQREQVRKMGKRMDTDGHSHDHDHDHAAGQVALKIEEASACL